MICKSCEYFVKTDTGLGCNYPGLVCKENDLGDEWIKTQDKLPPIGSKIKAKYDNNLISSGKVTRVILDRSYRKGSIVVGYDGESSRYHITHWKPLQEKQLPQKTVTLEQSHCHLHGYQLRYDDAIYCLAEMDSIDARGLCDWVNIILESDRNKE